MTHNYFENLSPEEQLELLLEYYINNYSPEISAKNVVPVPQSFKDLMLEFEMTAKKEVIKSKKEELLSQGNGTFAYAMELFAQEIGQDAYDKFVSICNSISEGHDEEDERIRKIENKFVEEPFARHNIMKFFDRLPQDDETKSADVIPFPTPAGDQENN